MKLLMVGAGGFAETYLNKLLDEKYTGRLALAGVVDPFVRNSRCFPALDARGIPCYGTCGEFFRHGYADMAAVASPSGCHRDQAVFLMENGCDVLLEKPLSATVSQAEEIIAARNGTGRKLALGFQWCYDPVMLRFKRNADAGSFGKPLRLRALVLWPRGAAYYRRGTGWAGTAYDASGRPVFDSVAMNATAHYLLNMLWIAHPGYAGAQIADAQVQTARAFPIETYDTAVFRFHLTDGVEIFFAASHAAGRENETGPELVYEFERATARFRRTAGGENHLLVESEEGIADYGVTHPDYGGKLEDAAAAFETGAEIPCTAETALMHVRAVELAREIQPQAEALPDILEEPDGFLCSGGLAGTLRRCFEERKLPREMGIRWS